LQNILLCLLTVAALCYVALVSRSLPAQASDHITITCACCAAIVVLIIGLAQILTVRKLRLRRQEIQVLFSRASVLEQFKSLIIVDEWKCIKELTTLVREFSERERLIADYSSDVIICLSADLRILSISPAVRKHWALDPAALVGASIDHVIHRPITEDAHEHLRRMGPDLAVHTFETQVATGSNTVLDTLWTVEYSKSDALLFVIAADITARKTVERLRRQLFSMLGHDLRVPLTAIQFTLSAIGKDATLSAATRESLLEANRSVYRAINLSTDMLDLQQAEEGKLNLKRQQIALSELVASTITEFQAQLTQQDQAMETDVPEGLGVMADEDRLKQVLANVISNAIKYGSSGRIVIEGKSAANVVQLSIHNSGTPIADQDKERLFLPYGQIRTTEEDQIMAGSGLGLALSKLLVNAMSGTITVFDSDVLSGACFTITLPACSWE
jgi:PAS domain S-box-containing protein